MYVTFADKEVKEEQLKNQLHELRREIYESKSEKRNMLIRKTFHDKHGFGYVIFKNQTAVLMSLFCILGIISD